MQLQASSRNETSSNQMIYAIFESAAHILGFLEMLSSGFHPQNAVNSDERQSATAFPEQLYMTYHYSSPSFQATARKHLSLKVCLSSF